MDEYSLVMFFIKQGKPIHEAVKEACRIIDWFSYEVKKGEKLK